MRYFLLVLCISFLKTDIVLSQSAPRIQMQKCYGGSSHDELGLGGPYGQSKAKLISRDKKHIFITGVTMSSDGDVEATQGFYDIWVAKVDLTGSIIWKRNINGHGADIFYSLTETSDGKLLIIGASFIWPLGGTYDALIIKLDVDGTLLWKKYLGGSAEEEVVRIIETMDGNYLFAGASNSSDGDLTGQPYKNDIWVGKINKEGTLLWNYKYSGIGTQAYDYTVALKEDSRGNLIVGANCMDQSNADSTLWHYDILLLRLDSSGSQVSRKVFAGNGNDYLHDLELLASGEIILAGNTESPDRDFSQPGYSGMDGFLMKLDSTGTKTWLKKLGGSGYEEVQDVVVLPDGSYLGVGYTTSTTGDLAGNTIRNIDAWVFSLADNGRLRWSKTYGGSKVDMGAAIDYFNESDFIFFGVTESNDFDVSGNHGETDLWLVKLGNSNEVKGTVFYDTNLNGIKDNTEEWAERVTVTATKNNLLKSTITNNGFFSIQTDTGQYVIEAMQKYYSTVPASYTSNFSTYLNSDSFSFALQPIANKQDLNISLIPLTPSRPGFATTYKILYKNVGTTTIAAGEVLFKRDGKLSLTSATPAISSSNGDTLKWNLTNFAPGDSASIILQLKVTPPPAVNINDTLKSIAIINPSAGDETPIDDTAILKQIVIGSYDPNDKAEINGGLITQAFITKGNYLQYTIRFQNTGTDTAFNIVVRDTLSSLLNFSTLEILAASHPYSFTATDGDKLAWSFNDINLPDSNINEPASHGYIVYRVRPKGDVVQGETIHNTASIYFDYNLPVVTNDATTQVQTTFIVLPVVLLEFDGQYKNNASILKWKTSGQSQFDKFVIERSLNGISYNEIGTRNSSGAANYLFEDDLSAIQSNVFYYRLKMTDAESKITYSRIVVLYKNEDDNRNLSVYPNPLFTAEAFITLDAVSKGKVEIRILDASGKLIIKQFSNVEQGKNTIPLQNINRLKAGVYTINIIDKGRSTSTKLSVFY